MYVKDGINGIPEINLPPLEPYEIESLKISQGKQSPVAITLNFYNSLIRGLAAIKIDRVV